jgi:A1 cistron-splicing factor AAR2
MCADFTAENELLAQMQLAFVIFSQIQNFSALDSYKAYLSMLCRATSTFLPTSNGMSSDRSLRLCADLLEKVLSVHVDYLRNEFFHEDLPGLDTFLQEELGNLRMSLRAAYRQYMPSNRSRGTLTSMSGDGRAEAILTESFKTLHKAWEDLRKVAEAKFGWLLGRLEPDDITVLRLHKGRLEYNLLSEPDEEDEYREEGEDAPVVVEM